MMYGEWWNWSPEAVGWGLGFALLLLVIYYLFMGLTILSMLRYRGHTVLLVFACIGLIPFPPLVLMGIVLMLIWAAHRGSGR